MTSLYIRPPARAGLDATFSASLCEYALLGPSGELVQQGAAALAKLGALITQARRVVLLLSAADVTLLRVAMPPLSPARLRLALPALVEEHILADPQECVLAAAPLEPGAADGARTVAVVARPWLEALVKSLLAQGARAISAVPAQLCLPLPDGGVAAAIAVLEHGLEVTLRLSQQEGVGLLLSESPAAALETLQALAAGAPLTLYLPVALPADVHDAFLALAASLPGITIETESWPAVIAQAKTAAPDLIGALGSRAAPARNWRQWRWPVRLALLAVLLNLAGLNFEWLQLKREADTARLTLLQTFKAAYPNQRVILDPAAQMRQNIARAKQEAGQLGPDEFTALGAALGDALISLPGHDAGGVIASLEYRDGVLFVKPKPDMVDAKAMLQIRSMLAARNLELSETVPGVWQIHSISAGAKS